ncbi:MAG: CDP-diacylglycerol--glycerol-3-phosphate 3-phosphatidyltransferase [Acidobacteriota bacterium]
MNLPNALTIFRIFLVPPLVGVLLTSPSPAREIWGFIVFAAAASTDYFDGYLARKRAQITTLGKLLDPLADKLLISAAFVSLVELDIAPAWMVVIVISRELAVTGLRGVAAAKGVTISASRLGKVKMAAQVVCVLCLIVASRFPDTRIYRAGQLLLWLVVILALISMYQYFRRFWSQIEPTIENKGP